MVALAVHPERAAASRLRVLQFGPALAQAGIELRFWSFIADSDETSWLNGGWRCRTRILVRGMFRLRLLRHVLRGARVVIVHREVMPFGPALVELVARRGRKLVWDVDDSVWRHHTSVAWLPHWLRSTGGKYRRLAASADEVWAGSEILAAWCRQHNADVHIVPTVVDVPPLAEASSGKATATWIGSPTTAPFVEGILPALVKMESPPRVLLVGGRPGVPEGLDAKVLDWSLEAEGRALAEAQVGLYPVDRNHPLAEGKCGLKAILYLAHGLVPVVTPTATNASIVQDGLHGRHAEGEAQWATVVTELFDNEDERRRLRRAGHAHVSEQYSLVAWAPRLVARLQHLAEAGPT